jgi:uncharacterized protein YjbI with pentapeptide repeats
MGGAQLKGTNLKGANLTSADLYGARLTGATLSGAIMTDTNLKCAKMVGVIRSQKQIISSRHISPYADDCSK